MRRSKKEPQRLHPEIGIRIRMLRLARKWNQGELSYNAKITPAHLGLIERGKQNPTLDTRYKIADGLQVKLDELFQFDEPADPSQPAYQLSYLQSRLNRLPPDQQRKFYHCVEPFLELLELPKE